MAPTGDEQRPACRYEAGQVWTFRDAPLPQSRVVIGRLDHGARDGWIVSVSITNVYVPDTANGGRYLTDISHAPMTVQALDASVIAQDGEGASVHDFEDGYGEWRAAFDKGEAGVFTIGAADIVSVITEAVAKGK
jgi:hypothetical protein